MFAKLLKHEFMATGSAMGILCLTGPGAAVVGGVAMRYLMWAARQDQDLNALITMCTIALLFSILAISLCGVGALVMMIVRFYRSRFTDEGYLTFTLPVTGHQVLLSSILNSVINMFIASLVVTVSLFVLVWVGISGTPGYLEAMRHVPVLLREAFAGWGWTETRYLVMFAYDGLASFIYSLVLLMTSVTIGAVAAKKHKIIAAVATYYGMNMLLSIFSAALIASGAILGDFEVVLTLVGVMSTTLALIGYFLMHHLITRKLNLP